MRRMLWHREHLPDPLPAEPLTVAATWLDEALRAARTPNPNATVLATAGADGAPSARVVLCKEIVVQPGYLTFYSNYQSRKGRELAGNARAAAVLHWDHFHRQVRIEGRVVRAAPETSDRYFASRNWRSRVGAWASQQSEPVESRATLLKAVASTALRLSLPIPRDEDEDRDPGVRIPRPPHWGGYHLWAEAVELWVEGSARIHDRARWTRTLQAAPAEAAGVSAYTSTVWQVTRLQP